MGQDIARPEQVEQLGQFSGRAADVEHHAGPAYPGQLRGLDGAPEWLEAVIPDDVEHPVVLEIAFADFDTQQKPGVLGQDLRRQLDIGVVDVEHLTDWRACQAHVRYVEQSEGSPAGLAYYPVMEAREAVCPRCASLRTG